MSFDQVFGAQHHTRGRERERCRSAQQQVGCSSTSQGQRPKAFELDALGGLGRQACNVHETARRPGQHRLVQRAVSSETEVSDLATQLIPARFEHHRA